MKEEEAARAKEAARREELKQVHEAEEKCSKLNRLKILNQWRKLMRLVKVEDLRKEIEVISQNHEREVDRKDAIIQVLDRDLEDSEEQYQTAQRAHLVMVDQLIDLHNAKLAGIELEFENDMQELMDEFGAERYEIASSHARHKKEMVRGQASNPLSAASQPSSCWAVMLRTLLTRVCTFWDGLAARHHGHHGGRVQRGGERGETGEGLMRFGDAA